MRFPGLIAALMMATPAFAQELVIPPVNYPALPTAAKSAEGFVPKGWRLESRTEGDLDNDGKPDLVLVLRQQRASNIVQHDGMGQRPLDTNPRILAVAWSRPDIGYVLAMQNHSLIPRHEIPTLDDMLEETGGVSVQRGTLRVALHFFASAGTWSMGTTTYTFRWQNGAFELIGYDRDSVMRNSGVTENMSVNFSTGKVKRTTGSIENDAEKVTWQKLPSSRRWTIDSIGDGAEFDPLSARTR